MAGIEADINGYFVFESDGQLYDGDGMELEPMEITCENLQTFGTPAVTADLKQYKNPKVYGLEPFSINISAVSPPQRIITELIDLTDPSIKGIERVEVVQTGDPLYAISFDGGGTWYAHTSAWVLLDNSNEDTGMDAAALQSISLSQWHQKINGINGMLLRMALSEGDTITKVFFDFAN